MIAIENGKREERKCVNFQSLGRHLIHIKKREQEGNDLSKCMLPKGWLLLNSNHRFTEEVRHVAIYEMLFSIVLLKNINPQWKIVTC